MNLLRVLAIAPYEGLCKLMTEIAGEIDNIQLEVRLGDLDDGVLLTEDNQSMGYDFIISRGGTAQMIEQIACVPVVEIQLLEYDIIQSIKLAQSFTDRFCIVGFPNIINRIHTLCNLMEFNVDTRTIHNADEACDCLEILSREGCELVVGDTVTVSTAKRLKMNGILITSGRDSIIRAIEDGRKIHRAVMMALERNLFFHRILDNSFLCVVVYDRFRRILYSNIEQQSDSSLYAPIAQNLSASVDFVFKNGLTSLVRKAKGILWNIRGASDGRNVYFYIRRSIEFSLPHQSVVIKDMLQPDVAQFPIYYNASNSIKTILITAEKLAGTRLPILILGEQGTGKDTIAYFIHQQSELRNNSFLTINCQLLNDEQLIYLLCHENSPLGETDMGIYFKNIQCLSKELQQMLVSYLHDTLLHRRNRVLYSHAEPAFLRQGILTDYLLSEQSNNCATLTLPPLRERKEDIRGLASIYINELNIALGKQVAGLDAVSLELLRDFDWPFNIDQLIKVLRELIMTSEFAFIKAEDTLRALKKEQQLAVPTLNYNNNTFLYGSLEDIISNIVQKVFEEEDMNQTRTAKRLGISRSTLWRKLNRTAK